MRFAAITFLLSALARDPSAAAPPPLVFTHATVIDMTGAPPRFDTTVIVRGNRIDAIGKAGKVRVPRGAKVVDASGKFLIPGLWDMHVHFDEIERSLPLFVANGVTGVRNMGGDLDSLVRWEKEIATGRLLGPGIVSGGPILDGPDPAAHGPTISVGTAAEARQAVSDLARRGARFVKVYDRLPREAYFAIVDEAKRARIPVVGHVPLAVSTMEASDAGQRSIEHLGTILEGASSQSRELRRLEATAPPPRDPSDFPRRIAARGERMLDTYDEKTARELFARLARNQTWQVPTLIVKYTQTFVDDLARAGDPREKYVPAPDREWWSPQKNFFARYRTPEYIVLKKRLYRKELELVGSLHRAGVPLMTGTDLSSAWVFAGFSLHDELALFVEAGLTPMEALAAATRNPAIFFNELATAGTIERGKRADLVLLDADPLADIKNTRRIRAVVRNGRYLPREELDRLLAGVEASARAGGKSE